jgi:hypothetical protein
MNDTNPLDFPNNQLSQSGKPKEKAISSGEQAYAIASKLESDQINRNNFEALVDKKYNGDLPFSRQALRDSGEAWRHNFNTNFMSGVISKIIPAPVGLIDGSQYLTMSYLCDETPEAANKTEIFRDKITTAIRTWNGWKNFQYSLWTEVILHGNAIVACLNPFTPWPEMYRTDRAFLPSGTGQHATNVSFFSAKKDFLVHEFVEFIKDKEIADEAGWDTDASIQAVNDALPKRTTGIPNEPRSYEDAIREGNPGASYSGAKVIEVFHVLAVEPDSQKVTQYIVNRNGKHEVLFQKDERFDNIKDVITLFTLEPGNGTFYGSKGTGRLVYNLSLAIEANRNKFFDQLHLAGMTIFKTDLTKTPTMQLKIRHPFLIVAGDGDIEQQPIAPDVAVFKEADDQAARWVEQAIGAYISDLHGEDQGPHPTATEEQIRAQREQQFKIAFLARAWGQHSELISIIQRRLCDPDTQDDIAKGVQKDLEEAGLLPEEIKELAESPVAQVVQDVSNSKDQKVIGAFQVLRGDPNVDQHKLLDRTITAMVDPNFTKDILLDEQGLQANEIEGYRQQILEDEAMIQGASMPVSPRDPHEVHLKTALGELKMGLPQLAASKDPKMMDAYNLTLRHLDGHIQAWTEAKGDPQQIKPYQDAINGFDKALEAIAQDAQKGAANAQNGPQNAPQQPPGGQIPPPEDHIGKIASSITYKDAPDDVKRQIEAAAGFQPSTVGAVGNSTLPAANIPVVHNAVAMARNPNLPNPEDTMIRPPMPPVQSGPTPTPPQPTEPTATM